LPRFVFFLGGLRFVYLPCALTLGKSIAAKKLRETIFKTAENFFNVSYNKETDGTSRRRKKCFYS